MKIKRKRASADEMMERHAALINIVADIRPCIVRQVFYQATVRYGFEKTERGYDKVQAALTKLRRSGAIPFTSIVDNTRSESRLLTFESPSDAVVFASRSYRKDLWADADSYVQVWLEKDSLAGVVSPITERYDVGLWTARGYPSITFLKDAAEYIQQAAYRGVPAYIYHLGDADPSGENAAETIDNALREFAPDADMVFTRLAVLPEQIEQWNLPTRPTKASDSRAKKFGDRPSVELDAIHPDQLRSLVEGSILRHMPSERFAALMQAEASERHVMRDLGRADGQREATMTSRPCRDCGQLFRPAKEFHSICWGCWHERATSETAWLRDEVARLRRRLAQPWPAALDRTAIRWMLQLVHPDRHSNSPLSNAVTAALLQMRERVQ